MKPRSGDNGSILISLNKARNVTCETALRPAPDSACAGDAAANVQIRQPVRSEQEYANPGASRHPRTLEEGSRPPVGALMSIPWAYRPVRRLSRKQTCGPCVRQVR